MQPSHLDEQAVHQLLNEFSEAVLRQDGAAIDRMWADDYAFVTPNGVVLNKTQRLKAITAPDTRFDFVSKDEQELHLYANTAVEIVRTSIQGQILGRATDQKVRTITVLAKQAGCWQMVAQQSNVIPTA